MPTRTPVQSLTLAESVEAAVAGMTTGEVIDTLAEALTHDADEFGLRLVVARLTDALTGRLPEVDEALAMWDTDMVDDRTAGEVALDAARRAVR